MRFIPARAGNMGCHVYETQLIRFIPARAGNIFCAETRQYMRPVHPRTCGEHI